VVSDVIMPEMDGPTLLKELRKTNPSLKFIFVSGYPDDAFKKSLDDDEAYTFLPKPFTLPQLAAKVKEQLAEQRGACSLRNRPREKDRPGCASPFGPPDGDWCAGPPPPRHIGASPPVEAPFSWLPTPADDTCRRHMATDMATLRPLVMGDRT